MTTKAIKITASQAADVVGYRVTLFKDGVAVASKDYADDASIAVDGEPNKRRFVMFGDPAFAGLDDTYEAEIRAIDDGGNTSGPLGGSIAVDFLPPDSPKDFEPLSEI